MSQIFPKIFSRKFSRICCIWDCTPFWGVKMSYMGGIRRGGGGRSPTMGVCQDRGIPHQVINMTWCRLITKLIIIWGMFGSVDPIHYLCIDNVREMSGWGNNTSWSVDSSLPYIFI
jgi:hypothetical protein